MRFTKEHLDAGMSSNGAWSDKQLKILNVNHKKSGWKQRAFRRDYHPDDIAEFIALKDAHLVDGQNVFQRRRAKKEGKKPKVVDADAEGEKDRINRFEYKVNA